MSGITDLFADLAATSTNAYIDDPNKLINDATYHTYLLRHFLKGAPGVMSLQGGPQVAFQRLVDLPSLTVAYDDPLQEFDLQFPQFVRSGSYDWRFEATPMTWSDNEIALQVPRGLNSKERFVRLHGILESREQATATMMINYMEDSLYAPASTTTMRDGKKPNSINVFISEQAAGSRNDWSGTIGGIDPTDATQAWDNQRTTYDWIDGDTAGSDKSLFQAFDKMWHLVKYQKMPKYPGHSEEETPHVNFITTSSWGERAYKRALRASNDYLAGAASRQDPSYMDPRFVGVPVLYISTLDTAAIYPDASTGYVVEESADKNGPRFDFIDNRCLQMIFHEDRYFKKIPTDRNARQPMANTVWYDTYRQFVATSRRKLGRVAPSADISSSFPK